MKLTLGKMLNMKWTPSLQRNHSKYMNEKAHLLLKTCLILSSLH